MGRQWKIISSCGASYYRLNSGALILFTGDLQYSISTQSTFMDTGRGAVVSGHNNSSIFESMIQQKNPQTGALDKIASDIPCRTPRFSAKVDISITLYEQLRQAYLLHY